MAVPVIVLQPGTYYGTEYDMGETFEVADTDLESLSKHVEMGNLHPTDVGAYTEAYAAQDYAYTAVLIEDLQDAVDVTESLETISLSALKTLVDGCADFAAFKVAVAALTTGSKPSAFDSFKAAVADLEPYVPPLGRRWS